MNSPLTRRQIAARMTQFTLLTVLLGIASGAIWHAFVKLPTFITGDDRTLAMSERSSMQLFRLDAGFVLIGLVVGLIVGVLAWYRLNRLGWPVAFVSSLGGALAGLLCWGTGWLIGPRDFYSRVATAQPGQEIPIDFTLRSPSGLVIWALAALLPVLLYSALTPKLDAESESDVSQ